MRLSLYLLLLLFATACADTPDAGVRAEAAAPATNLNNGLAPNSGPAENPDITVTLTGAAPGNVILVGQATDQQFKALESASDANGTVRFTQSEPLPAGYYFAYFDDGSAAQMLLDADQTLTITADKNDVIGTARVEGNLNTELLYDGLRYEQGDIKARFTDLNYKLQNTPKDSPEYDALAKQRVALTRERMDHFDQVFADHPDSVYTSYKRAGQNPMFREGLSEQDQVTAYRYDMWNNVNFNDERLLRTPVIANKLKRYIKELTPQNADSIKAAADFLLQKVLGRNDYYQYFANWITLQYEPGKVAVMDAEAIHSHMIKTYFTRDRAFWSDSMTVYGLQQRADEMSYSLVGQQGPDITVPGFDGQPKRLYDMDEPYLIVYMYSPTCEHCIEETPILLQTLRGRSDIGVYAVALDSDANEWKTFVKRFGIQDWTNVMDPTNRSIYKTYYVDNTPEIYLLNKERKIIAKNLHPNQVIEAIRMQESK